MGKIHLPEHSFPIKTWKQLVVVAVLAFAVPIFLIFAVVQIVMGGLRTNAALPEMSQEAVAARIKPVGEVNLATAPAQPADSVAAPAPAATPARVATAPATAARAGEQVYQQACAMCHATGLAGAPKTGDKAGWQPRIVQGKSTLYQHAINGIRTMPARGGNASLSDAEVKAAVDYLAVQAK